MKKLLIAGYMSVSLFGLAQVAPTRSASLVSIEDRIANCESERRVLRTQILESSYFIHLKVDKTGDEIEALIYSVANFLTDGHNQEGREIASETRTDVSGAENIKAYMKNRNELNSLYLQRKHAQVRQQRLNSKRK